MILVAKNIYFSIEKDESCKIISRPYNRKDNFLICKDVKEF